MEAAGIQPSGIFTACATHKQARAVTQSGLVKVRMELQLRAAHTNSQRKTQEGFRLVGLQAQESLGFQGRYIEQPLH